MKIIRQVVSLLMFGTMVAVSILVGFLAPTMNSSGHALAAGGSYTLEKTVEATHKETRIPKFIVVEDSSLASGYTTKELLPDEMDEEEKKKYEYIWEFDLKYKATLPEETNANIEIKIEDNENKKRIFDNMTYDIYENKYKNQLLNEKEGVILDLVFYVDKSPTTPAKWNPTEEKFQFKVLLPKQQSYIVVVPFKLDLEEYKNLDPEMDDEQAVNEFIEEVEILESVYKDGDKFIKLEDQKLYKDEDGYITFEFDSSYTLFAFLREGVYADPENPEKGYVIIGLIFIILAIVVACSVIFATGKSKY